MAIVSHPPPRLPFAGAVAAAVCLLWAAAPVEAAHRARLSADLADHLSAGSQAIDVIVDGDQATVDAIALRYNVPVKRHLKSGAVIHVNAGQLAALQQDGQIDHLSGDVRIQSSMADVTAASIGADRLWAGAEGLEPLSGEGVTVAVIDSGIDGRHVALRGRVVATRDFTGGDGVDRFGHGTHVASLIAGRVGRTLDTRDYRGIASGALLVNLRVLGDDGSGVASDVIEAIDWAIAHRHEYRIRVINLSLGAPVLQPYRDDPLCEAVERAVQVGLVVVVAAGNNGRSADGRTVLGSITSPGNSPHALTVGAIDTHETAARSDDTLAPYSSRGPTRYDLVLKPDMAAPGSHLVGAEAADAYLPRMHPDHHVSGLGANAYMQLSGTSMAAGVVSGAVALLLEEKSSLSPAHTKAALQLTSTFMAPAGLVGAGAGSVNLLAAAKLSGQNPGGRDRMKGALNSPTNPWPVGTPGGTRIYWGMTGETIYWGTARDTIYWGTADDTIYWGTAGDTIYWGTADDTIYWGTADDTIYWGTASAADLP